MLLAGLADSLDRSTTALASPALLQESELGDVLGALDGVAARTHALLVAVAREGLARGLHQEAGFSDVDWVRLVCPGLASRTAIEIAMVARAAQQRVHALWGTPSRTRPCRCTAPPRSCGHSRGSGPRSGERVCRGD